MLLSFMDLVLSLRSATCHSDVVVLFGQIDGKNKEHRG